MVEATTTIMTDTLIIIRVESALAKEHSSVEQQGLY
jgi:hypothetical protein